MTTYWPDHLWPNGYWTSNYWHVLEPATMLSVSTDEAFPDGPGMPPRSLRADLESGHGGSFLTHDAEALMPILHQAFCLAPASLVGTLTLGQALDTTWRETWRIIYDSNARRIKLVLQDGQTIEQALVHGLQWHCIEVGVDTEQGQVKLWVNGVLAGTCSNVGSEMASRHLRLGVIDRSADAAGSIRLDAWRIDVRYLGPVSRVPVKDTGDDPARWLVIYNTAWPNAGDWVQRYVDRRHVPYANLLGLPLSGDETIDGQRWESLREAVVDYLDRHDADGRILGVLVGVGVPGLVELEPGGPLVPLASLLATLRTSSVGTSPIPNPLSLDARPQSDNLQGCLLTARMDAADAAAATAWIDEASDPVRCDWRRATVPTFFVTAHTDRTAETGPWIDAWSAWAASTAAGGSRMRLAVSEETVPPSAGWPDQLTRDGLFWGWVAEDVPTGFIGAAGPRGFAFPVLPTTATAPSMRIAGPDWFSTLRSAGYLAVGGTCGPLTVSELPDLAWFSHALVDGWALGEAWFTAQAVLGGPLYLAADPLMVLTLPRAGWDLFGPADTMEVVDPEAPLARLHADATSFMPPPSAWPANGESAVFLLRRIGEFGQSEAGATSIRLTRTGDELNPSLRAPIWPPTGADESWPVMIRDGLAEAHLLWDGPLRRDRISEVALQVLTNEGLTTARKWTVGRERTLTWRGGPPLVTARYRWRLVADDGREWLTSWSREVSATQSNHTLQLLETRP